MNIWLRKMGYMVVNYSSSDRGRRSKIVSRYNIDTLFDVGANMGQYAKQMRALGYDKKIISFEPLSKAFKSLKKAALKDDEWIVNNYALGHENANCFINVAGNSYSSSILDMLPRHSKCAPDSKYISREKIDLKKLDDIFHTFCTKEAKVMLKIDTQGYEKNVLKGAEKVLPNISIIQLEMALVPLYNNEMLYIEMIDYLKNKGFELFSLENGFSDPSTGKLLQVDGIFTKIE